MMSTSDAKELAYRYDLFVTPLWRDRFDSMLNEKIKLPSEGRILDVNCGTGALTIELAERLKSKGEVIGIDPDAERVTLAQAKALVKKLTNITFQQGSLSDLPFESHEFAAVIGDASMLPEEEIEDLLAEMIRVAASDARVVLRLATKGSFDEFFSIYWEALHDAEIESVAWSSLEALINERRTISDSEAMAERLGLRKVESFVKKEEFSFESGEEFLESPLIADNFLSRWLEIIPDELRMDVRRRVATIIDRERHDGSFEVSIKATLITGLK